MFRGLSRSKVEHSGLPMTEARRVTSGKSELAITAPRRIVRALYPYVAQHEDELSFNKNDFFYVNEEPSGDWYIASNPLTNVRGLVPQSYFEVIQRQDPQVVPVSEARRAHSRTNSNNSPPSAFAGQRFLHHRATTSQGSQASSNPRASLAIYGYVLFDFKAERDDELTVAASESIVIVAQSTDEWFVAKPIGRLGGPGLIPVSYVELREVGSDKPLTDVTYAIRRANLPQVDEWKRKLAEYKASSIPLGRFGTTSEQLQHNNPVYSRDHSRSGSTAPSQSSYDDPHQLLRGSASTIASSSTRNNASLVVGGAAGANPYVIAATVDRFAVNGGRYWYLVKVELSNGRHRNLCRFYQDFYDFQIKLLEQFPEEAGRTGKTRTLPFMPGPLTLVTHTVSSKRRANLDDYVRDLIRMPPHVSQSSIVLQLFSLRAGDVESGEATQQLPQPPQSDAAQKYSGDIPAMMNSQNPYSTQSYLSPQLHHTRTSTHTQLLPQKFAHTQSRLSKSTSSEPAPVQPQTLKIKIFAASNVIAIRVPVDIPFSEVYDKIAARLSVPNPQLYTSNDGSGELVDSAAKFARALNGGTKVALYLKS